MITFTEHAQEKVRSLIEAQGRDDLCLRLAVQPALAPLTALLAVILLNG